MNHQRQSLAGPLVLILVGTLFLLDKLIPEFSVWDIFRFNWWRWWPVLLIAIGFVQLAKRLAARGGRF